MTKMEVHNTVDSVSELCRCWHLQLFWHQLHLCKSTTFRSPPCHSVWGPWTMRQYQE